MTILAQTKDYLVEFEAGFLSIARYTDGHCKAWKRIGIAGEFRDALKSAAARGKGPDHVIDLYLKMMRKAEWEPLYKASHMPGIDLEHDEHSGRADELRNLKRLGHATAAWTTTSEAQPQH